MPMLNAVVSIEIGKEAIYQIVLPMMLYECLQCIQLPWPIWWRLVDVVHDVYSHPVRHTRLSIFSYNVITSLHELVRILQYIDTVVMCIFHNHPGMRDGAMRTTLMEGKPLQFGYCLLEQR